MKFISNILVISIFIVPILFSSSILKINFSQAYKNKSNHTLKKSLLGKYYKPHDDIKTNYINFVKNLILEKQTYTNAIVRNSFVYKEYQ